MVRNPYNPVQITKYNISPDVVDIISFCTKNPASFPDYMDLLKEYGQYWFVTITPYGKGNNPVVGMIVAVAVSIEEAAEQVYL